jgi:hypothetical protein
MNNDELKAILQDIKKNDYAVPEGSNAFELGLVLVDRIGILDSEIRDDLIYTILHHWIFRDVFTDDQKIEITKILLQPDHLLYGLGEKDTDSVFTRAFSVLQFAVLVYKHREKSYLPEEIVQEMYQQLARLIKEEQDVRGYVPVKGWAHCVAHSADVIDEFALYTPFGIPELREILAIIRDRIMLTTAFLNHQEDERLMNAVMSVLSRQLLDQKEIEMWIRSFKEKSGTYENLPESYGKALNIKTFLRSMYFRMKAEPQYEVFVPIIEDTLKNITR